jgi:hypothetical protein
LQSEIEIGVVEDPLNTPGQFNPNVSVLDDEIVVQPEISGISGTRRYPLIR